MKTFILNSKDFGRQSTFNAINESEARQKLNKFIAYHSAYGCYTIEETNELNPIDLDNTYLD